MSQNLTDLITKTLGVVQTAPAAPKFTGKYAPCRPEPEYEYRIAVSRNEYGVAYIRATSADSAFDLVGSEHISWEDYGDVDWDGADVEQQEDEPANQDELDEWDMKYGGKYTHDGQPMCSECEYVTAESSLTTDPDDADRWLCPDCTPSTTANDE